jgi:hypothetical protein
MFTNTPLSRSRTIEGEGTAPSFDRNYGGIAPGTRWRSSQSRGGCRTVRLGAGSKPRSCSASTLNRILSFAKVPGLS